jgi:signal transduction histidine kinase
MQPIAPEFQVQLVRGLTHRMNNILTLFHGYLGMLMEDSRLDSVTREGLKRIHDGASEAAVLIARTEAAGGAQSGLRREVDLAAFFRQLAPSFETLRGPEVRIVVECADDLPRVSANPARLKAGLIELVRNACEAAVSTVTIRVTVIETQLEAGFPCASEPWIRIAVTDDGHGVPSREAKRIYEPFFSTKKGNLSAGLGLAVAQGAAMHAGGRLRHQSCEGETTFEMLLPGLAAQELGAVA